MIELPFFNTVHLQVDKSTKFDEKIFVFYTLTHDLGIRTDLCIIQHTV